MPPPTLVADPVNAIIPATSGSTMASVYRLYSTASQRYRYTQAIREESVLAVAIALETLENKLGNIKYLSRFAS